MNTPNILAVKAFQLAHPETNRPGSTVLDVGSMHVNGPISGRDLWAATYTGCDLAEGKNVDLVVKDENWGDSVYDTVVSLSCLEHTVRPWITVKNMAKAIKPGGYILTVAPFTAHYHCYPIDCWRFTPYSMTTMYNDAGLLIEKTYLSRPSLFRENNWSYRFWRTYSIFRHRIPQIECVAWGRKPF